MKKNLYILAFLAIVLSACKQDNWIDWKLQNELWMANPKVKTEYSSIPIHTTASGLKYQVLSQGNITDAKPSVESTVIIDYKGSLINGIEFDKGQNAQMQVANTVSGFAEGLRKMNVQGDYVIYIPWELGYGKDGGSANEVSTAYIPPYSTLIFEIHLSAVYN